MATCTRDLPIMLKSKEAAGLLSVCDKQIRDMCAEGTIHAVKVGAVWRIPRDEFLRQFGLASAE